MERRSSLVCFWLLAVARFLCVPPFVIDDDEAWWTAASNAMKSPFDFYRSAADHKPPGVVWFYWLVNHLIPCASDPRVIRAVYTLLTIAAAYVLGRIAAKFTRNKSQSWLVASLFLVITAIPTPKLLAVTADGLMIDLTIFGYALALLFDFPGVSVLAGVILGGALLIKQTAVFFCIPILFATWPRKWSWKEIMGFALGAALVVVPTIVGVGMQDFVYWTWTYPKQVLTTVREQLFHSTLEMFESIGIFLLATLPLWVRMLRTLRPKPTDFRVLWLVAGILAAFLGKGLFLHYLLLFAPPFALLAADALSEGASRKTGTYLWIGAQYAFGLAVLMVPFSGVFWGTDLVYFDQLSRVMKKSLRPGEKVLVWGGSALPLTFTGAEHVTRFVLPRFAVAPYATNETKELFHQELSRDIPALILDLHERGDNQFNNPIQSEPFVSALVSKNYHAYISETVPWAKFYFLQTPPAEAGLIELKDAAEMQLSYAAFPQGQRSWMKLVELAKGAGPRKMVDTDWSLRAQAGLELLERQSSSPETKSRAHDLRSELTATGLNPDLRKRIDLLAHSSPSGLLPLPMVSLSWWPTVALVELQPKAMK